MQAENRPRRARLPRALVALAALLAIAVAAPAVAQADPTLSVDKTTGLSSLEPTEVTVDGTDFTPAFPGVYVAQTAIVEGQVVTGSARWVCHTSGPPPAPQCPGVTVPMDGTGAFETTLEIEPTFTDGDVTVDCAEVQCSVSTWAAHTVPIPAGDTPDPEANPAESPLLDSVDLEFAHLDVDPVASLSGSQATTVAIDGSGFEYAPFGVYAAQTAIVDGKVVAGSARWICAPGSPAPACPPGGVVPMNPDGTFETTLDVEPTFTDGDVTVDCRVTTCSVSTWSAHHVPIPAGQTPDPEANPAEAPLLDSVELGFAKIEVAPGTDLPVSGSTAVTVDGSGFAPNQGVFVAQTAIVDGKVVAGALRWAFCSSEDVCKRMNTDGTLSAKLDVKSSFSDGETTVDCMQVACSVSVWKAHTTPIPADGTPGPGTDPAESPILASVPLTFKADPTPVPPATEPAAKVAAFKKAQKVNRKRIAKVARVHCNAEKRCKLTAPKRVRIKIGKKTFRVKVLAPKGIGAGKRGLVRIQLTKAARKLLAKRFGGSGQMRIQIEADGAKTFTQQVKIKLVGGKRKK